MVNVGKILKSGKFKTIFHSEFHFILKFCFLKKGICLAGLRMLVYHANCYILRSPSLSLLASVAAERGEHTISGYDEGHFFLRATKEFESRKPLWHPFWMGLTCDFLLSGLKITYVMDSFRIELVTSS